MLLEILRNEFIHYLSVRIGIQHFVANMADPGVGGENHWSGPDISRGTFFYEKTRYVYVKYFLIAYTHINTNKGPLTKLFLWFRLVINPFGIRFRLLMSSIPNFVNA
ncbi:hypothetical protein Hanom_Chr14g01293271 [Helianthus anomalus]